MATILVTGGAGFIGTNFVYYWRRSRPCDLIVILDALTYAGNLSNLELLLRHPMIRFVKGDICDEVLVRQLFTEHDFSTIVHLAAESHVDRSIVAPDLFIRTNVLGTHLLLRAALSAWRGEFRDRRFHHVSTDEVYGSLGPEDPPFTETTPYSPRSPYSARKAASDHLVRAYGFTYGLPISVSICSNNYGPYQFPEKLIPLMVVNALEGQPLPIYGDGLNVRDWMHVDDHCAAIEAVLEYGRPGETYNVGGGNEVTNIDLVRQLCDLVTKRLFESLELRLRFPNSPAARGRNCQELITFVKDRPGHDRRYAVNTTKVMKELGFSANRVFNQGLASIVDWYIEHDAWWKAIRSGECGEWIASHYSMGQ